MNELEQFEALIDKFFEDHSKEEILTILKKYDKMTFEGPKIRTYFKSIGKSISYANKLSKKDTSKPIPDYNILWDSKIDIETIFSENIIFQCAPVVINITSNISTDYFPNDTDLRSAA
jgi:hypothetical protein